MMAGDRSTRAPPSLSLEALGFVEVPGHAGMAKEPLCWQKNLGDCRVEFRLLRSVSKLASAELLQREVMKFSDRDLVSASELVVAQETGGDVIGAFMPDGGPEDALAVAIGLGGYRNRRPLLYSDLLAVRPEFRSIGLGFEMKRLQAALALQRGFEVIAWTVDPLRSANARLNFERLGAIGERYERDRYGASLGSELYGGLPTDRLHLVWEITSARVRRRLFDAYRPFQAADLAGAPEAGKASPGIPRIVARVPLDIDTIVKADSDRAVYWRLTLRASLEAAFDAGYLITGFVRDFDSEQQMGALVLQTRESLAAEETNEQV